MSFYYMSDLPFEECCEIVRNHKLFYMDTPEKMIEHALKVEESSEHGTTGSQILAMQMQDYAITEEIQVGVLTIGVVGSERSGSNPMLKKHEEGVRGQYIIYKDEPKFWVKEKSYNLREDVIKIAEVMNGIQENQCIETDIVFPTGELVFANFFCEDRDTGFDELPKDMKYKDEFGINSDFGVRNVSKWLAENRGIAYGQLGNTSVSVYKVGGDKIVIASQSAYTYDDDGYEVEIPVPEEWEKVGEICCDVWRFEAVDKQRFVEHNFDLPAYKEERDHMDFCETKVNAGEWKMKCYYNQMSDKQMLEKFGYLVYAELERVV